MTARDEILQRLQRQARPAVPPAPWRSRRRFASLGKQFAAALTAAGGEVIQAANENGALDALGDLLGRLEATRVLVDDVAPLNEKGLPQRWPDLDWRLAGRGHDDLRAFAAAADAGVSLAWAALAETGTVVIGSGPDTSRLTGLLPPVHVALVPGKRLTADLFTWTAARKGDWPAALTLISGPSKTADIEQTMAVGVHGPKRFIAILYD